MLLSTATVATDAAQRYAKQLVSHLGHKVAVEDVAGEPAAQRLVFAYGSGVVRHQQGALLLQAEAEDPESLGKVEDVLARHLVRFGRRHELEVSWQRSE